MQIIDCKKIKNDILNTISKEVNNLSFDPVFCDILVGNDIVSRKYVEIKSKVANSVGIKFRTVEFPESVTTEEIIEEIERLNNVPYICGIIIQLPLPIHINRQAVLDAISPKFDVDCLGSSNSEAFYSDNGTIGYPTALACIKILESLDLSLVDKNIVVLGQGVLVGRPVSHLIESSGYKVIRVDKNTENIKNIIKNADVIISGIGHGKFITGDMIKEGAVIIDAGTSEEDGSIVGDVDIESVSGIASFVTPSPGGVGPVTVAMLLLNVYKVAKNKNNNEL